MKYRLEIDGLRAVAVIPVILFHVGFDKFSGGYSGVDVFFVISGYLITSIIFSDFKNKEFSIVNFYERRLRRILPLLFFVLLVSIPLAWISLKPTDMVDYFKSLTAVPLFFSNFLFASEADYFDAAVELKPLLHTWSLAVEEQFYIFFPLLLMFFFKIKKQHQLIPFLLMLCIVSFTISELGSRYWPKFNFYLLPSRIWELGFGSVLAILVFSQNKWLSKLQNKVYVKEIGGILGLVLIIAGYFIIKSDSPFPSSYTLFPVIGSGLIILFSSKDTIVGKILSFRILVLIGLISYSAYLWHHLIFAFVRNLGYEIHSFTEKSVLSFIIFPISYISWKFIENPFRNKQKYNRKSIFLLSFLMSFVFIFIGILGVKYEGFPKRSVNSNLLIHNYNPDNRELQLNSWSELRVAEKSLKNDLWFTKKESKENLLIIGNSHSKDIYNVLNNSKSALQNFNLGRIGLQISEFSNQNHKFFSSQNYEEADIIMIASRYRYVDLPELEKLVEVLINDNKKVVIVKLIHHFKEVGDKTQADILIQKMIKEDFDFTNQSEIAKLVEKINKEYYRHYTRGSLEIKDISDKTISSIQNIYSQVIILDRMQYVCDEESQMCYAINSNLEKYFFDYAHHTLEGTVFFGKQVDKINWLTTLLEVK